MRAVGPFVFLFAFALIGLRYPPDTAFPAFLSLFFLASGLYFHAGLSAQAPNPRLWLPVALGVRLALLALDPTDDLHRYAFEGKALAAGFNPYFQAPSHPELAHLRGENFSRLNHPDFPAIYPPLALGIFSLVARLGENPMLFKGLFILAEALCLWIFWRAALPEKASTSGAKPPLRGEAADSGRAWFWFGMNPLLVLESAGHAHFEPLLMAALLSAWHARRRPLLFGWALAAAILIKPQAAVLFLIPALPALSSLRHGKVDLHTLGDALQRLFAPLAACMAVAVTAGPNLLRFATEFAYNAMGPSLLAWALPFLSRESIGFAAALCLGVSLVATCASPGFRRGGMAAQGLWLTGWTLFWIPTLHPWYLLWMLPFAALRGHLPWLMATCTVSLAYAVYAREVQTGVWKEIPWLRFAEYLPPLFLLLVRETQARFRKKRWR